MPNFGEQFLSRVLDDGTTQAIRNYSIERRDFDTQTEREVFDFISDYAKENGGKAPDYRTVVEQFPDFYYREGVTDSYSWLAKQIKQQSAKRQFMEYINSPDTQKKFSEMDGNIFLEDLQNFVESIRIRTGVRDKVGTSVKKDTEKIKEEYFRRKRGESFKIWLSNYSIINDVGGGYVSSNIYVPYGRSGRGKSAVTLYEALYLAEQGATVLIWSMEMGWFEVMVRLFVYMSAKQGVTKAEIDGEVFEAGFEARGIRQGSLSDEFEREFLDFIDYIHTELDGDLIVRGVDDEDFMRRDLRQLESEIALNDADVVVIDPFYYLDYERNVSRKTGGDAEETSKKLRRLAGQTKTVVFAITQAEETNEEKDEEGTREVALPERAHVKKTKQLLEDATMLIPIDTNHKEGRGLVGINKGRDGGEGEQCEITYLPQIGVIRELSVDNLDVNAFTKQF